MVFIELVRKNFWVMVLIFLNRIFWDLSICLLILEILLDIWDLIFDWFDFYFFIYGNRNRYESKRTSLLGYVNINVYIDIYIYKFILKYLLFS